MYILFFIDFSQKILSLLFKPHKTLIEFLKFRPWKVPACKNITIVSKLTFKSVVKQRKIKQLFCFTIEINFLCVWWFVHLKSAMSKVEIKMLIATETIVTISKMLFAMFVLRCWSNLFKSNTIARIHIITPWTTLKNAKGFQ